MRKTLKITGILLILIFIIIQFFQPEKNISSDNANDIFNKEQLPEQVRKVLANACADCHSDNTRYLWYHKIAPVSWLVSSDIKKGKKELNLSKWGEMDSYDKISALEDIRQELKQKTMPIKPYVIMHKEARLTDEDRAAMFAWIDKKGNELVKSSVKE